MLEHYERLAPKFEEQWRFSPEYKEWVFSHIGRFLELSHDDIFVDVGCATGSFTKMLHENFAPKKSYCLEPAQKLFKQARRITSIHALCHDASALVSKIEEYSKVLFKEVIHHIQERPVLYAKMHDRMPKKGKILLFTRPQRIRFPLFEAAHARFSKNQPSHEELVAELREAGFHVKSHQESFCFELQEEKWHEMLQSRFMSDLHDFTDEEILQGIEEVRPLSDNGFYTLCDDILFIVATK